MIDILLLTIIVLLVIAILLIWFRNPQSPALAYLQAQVATVQTAVDKLETGLKEDFRINRNESADLAKANRQELNETLHGFKAEQSQTLATITTHNRQALIDINQTLDDKVKSLTTTVDNNNNLNRDSLLTAFKTFQENFDAHIKTFNEVQRDKFTQMLNSQQTLISNTETKLENIRTTVEEKLEKTLSERLGQSFETVGKQLIEVQKGLGEMQTIATDVGGLKKVLSNVKLRGGVGEVQLALLLEQILAPSQYEANVKTKKGSSEPVEFAIKLPGRSDDENAFVYLPIDAKFPKDTYEHLLTAYETANPDEIESASKNLETTIKKMAKDIRDKYLDPPHTTDFAILFLPFESIYAEVIRRSALIDQLRTEFKITVAGPTTLMAILNSLQMGFRTLALQKRSSEVWQVLATVKKEFENFGGLLEKAQKNIQTGLGQLDDVVGTRTRAINRQLKQVESLPVVNARVEIATIDIPTTKDELGE
jgi:DNA recombination protein RmuC